MLVQFLALVFIVLVTAFYANQGLFSGALSLIAAIFASLLAMGLYEPLSGIIGSYRPAYAYGTTFLLVFFLALSGCRLAADYAVPKNIRFTKLIDTVAGGVVGFFAALVVIGSCVIGLEMLPLHTKLLNFVGMGFERYPEGMAGEQPGVAGAQRNVWFAPDRFTLALWNGASGRGLEGAKPFSSVHPDLTVESYGYRNTVLYSANGVLVPDLLSVDAAYASDAPEVLAKCHISGEGKQAAVVRIDVTMGTEQPKFSADTDNKFRITASEVRLVTDKGRQYYPTGHLVNGTTFEAMPLESGHLVDDYVGSKVIEEWVFQIERDEKPTLIEVKQLARKDLTEILKGKPFSALAATAYPKRDYRFNHGSVLVSVQVDGGPIVGAKVFVLPETTKVRYVTSEVQSAYDHITDALRQINEGIAPWSSVTDKPGVPKLGDLRAWQGNSRNNILLKGPDDEAQWSEIIPAVMVGASKPDGEANIRELPRYFDKNVVAMLNTNKTDVRAKGETGSTGTVELKDITPGTYALICSASTPEAYYSWCVSVKITAHNKSSETFTPARSGYFVVLKK